jgi:hypothetical protein
LAIAWKFSTSSDPSIILYNWNVRTCTSAYCSVLVSVSASSAFISEASPHVSILARNTTAMTTPNTVSNVACFPGNATVICRFT